MKWNYRSKRNSLAQEKPSKSSGNDDRSSFLRSSSTKTAVNNVYSNEKHSQSNSSLQSIAHSIQSKEGHTSTTASNQQLPSSASSFSIAQSSQKLSKSQSNATLNETNDSISSVNRSFKKLNTSSQRPFTGETYDYTTIKTGWINKGSNISNWTTSNSDNWRVYKAELKGAVLSLYKLPGDLNIKAFDPKTSQSEPFQSSNNVRHRRVASISSKSNVVDSKSSDAKSYSTISVSTISSNFSNDTNDQSKNSKTKLKYLSEVYPHPDLELNSANSIVSGTLESICHTILFNTLEDDKFSYNLLLIMPLLGDLKTSLRYFIEYSLTFTSQRIYNTSSVTNKYPITPNTDYAITQRLGLVITTIVDSFPGMLLDDEVLELSIKLISGIKQHDDHLAEVLKKSLQKKNEQMKNLTSFATQPYNSNASKSLTDVNSFLQLDTETLAYEINAIDLKFNKSWNPKTDPSLLYELENVSYPRLNPLIFNYSSNIHYLGRLLVNHLFGSSKTSELKRSQILSKWIEIGCLFDKIGDMVSWLAIATTICSIPILRLRNTWSYVDEKYLKIISTEWAPVVFELDRRTMISEANHKSSYHVIAPQGLGVTYSKNNVVPYFGDLTVKFIENSTLKQCEKRVQRIKVSFSRWDEYLQGVQEDQSSFDQVSKTTSEELKNELLNLMGRHVQLPPLTQHSVMELSLSVEPDANSDYHKSRSSRTPLVTGSYLPTLFTELIPSYKLFNQEVLIGASGFSTNKDSEIQPSNIDTSFPEVTGDDGIDAALNSNIPSSTSQTTFLRSVRDIFNIGSDVFHVDDDLIFKSLSKEDELKTSRPASVVLENPSSKRLSNIPTSNRLSISNVELNADGNLKLGDDFFAVLDSSKVLNSWIKPLNVVLKAGTFERMIDVLILTSNVFSKKIFKQDLDPYLEKSNLLDHQYLQLKMDNGVYTSTFFATYKSFASTTELLNILSSRFVGSKSAAISISRLNPEKEEEEEILFPDWNKEISNDDPELDWKHVGNIQIGFLEALDILVSDHYNDFTDSLDNKSIFVDLLKSIDNVIVVEWKEVLLKAEGTSLKNDLSEIYAILSQLYKKIRKNYIKKCYRPFDLFPNHLIEAEESPINFNELQLPRDFKEAEEFVERLDFFVNDLFNKTTFADWISVFQILEIQSSRSLTSLFRYKSSPLKNEKQLSILNVYSWLQSLFGDSIEDKILKKFPPPVKLLFELHDNLEKYFRLKLSQPSITRDIRTSIMASILQILTITRLRMSSNDLFISSTEEKVSPHVPSFIETSITQAIVSPESRAFTLSWIYAASAIKSEPVSSVEQILDLLPKLELSSLDESLKSSLTPCVGWFVEILLEISNFVPNKSIENSNLINFDKRRFTFNCITNIVDMRSLTAQAPQVDLKSVKDQFGLLFKLNTTEYFDFSEIEQAANYENQEYPNFDPEFRLFGQLLDSEKAKIQRDLSKKDILDTQERDIKRSQLLSQASSSLSLTRELTGNGSYSQPSLQNQIIQPSQASLGRKSRQNSSPSKVAGVGKRLGGLFKSVRPFSINVSSTWSGADRVLHPNDLPDIDRVSSNGKNSKPYQQLKLFNTKPLFVHSGIEGFFKIVSETGGEEFVFQATSNAEAQSWINALTLSKRYSYLSKDAKGLTSSKVFGVPIFDVCEREGTFIPHIVERLLQEIEVRGLDETGLYRIPGSVGSINLLKQAFDEGSSFTLEDDRWFEINTLAGCFKLYLRELPETLLTNELLGDFVDATKDGDLAENLKALVHQLPIHNYHLLKRLFEHLNKVIQHAEKNRMDSVNLAIVFSMSFLNNDSLGMSMGNELGALQTILQFLIKSPESVFQDQFDDDSTVLIDTSYE